MILVAFLLMFGCCVAVVLFIGREPASKKTIDARLAMMHRKVGEHEVNHLAMAEKVRQSLSDQISEMLKDYHIGESLERLIRHAGSSMSIGQVLLLGASLAVGGGMLARVFVGSWLVAMLPAAIASMIPYGLLVFQKSRRVAKFNEALPDAIDLMARALRAGHSMASSIEVVAQQSPKPLCTEFEMCFQQQKFGIPFRDAILEMGERLPSDDLQFLITAILVQKETGGDLTDILDRTTAVIRDRIRIHGEVATKTAQGRLTGWILSALPIVLLVVINVITPGYSHVLFADPLGQKLLMAGGVFILIGGFIISRIVDIKV